ncbi:NUDIX domain-containing protein [Candidatus Pacearchaeota archaeon]|nr:NUDIX domain-containing protein [Candidatus Pacearchaeota archaeon]
MNKAIRLVVIEDKKLLLVRKRDSWILPGGKPNEDEGGLECLLREIKEELQAEAIIGNFYDSFTGTISHKKNPWTEVIYFGKIKGIIYPSAEINDARLISYFECYNLSNLTKNIIKALKNDKYL